MTDFLKVENIVIKIFNISSGYGWAFMEYCFYVSLVWTLDLVWPLPGWLQQSCPWHWGCLLQLPKIWSLGFLHMAEPPHFGTTLWNAAPSSVKAVRASDSWRRSGVTLERSESTWWFAIGVHSSAGVTNSSGSYTTSVGETKM